MPSCTVSLADLPQPQSSNAAINTLTARAEEERAWCMLLASVSQNRTAHRACEKWCERTGIHVRDPVEKCSCTAVTTVKKQK
jgi:ferric-dicitrate binding protein FerR (iron transport regulator)